MPDLARYAAFISYSHHDKAWGDWLHKSLETYRVPKALVGKAARDGVVPARIFPVFRDREELPVSSDLGANIAHALAASRYLIVICSPHAAASRWVNEEILTFKRLGRADRVLALIVDGEPNASDGRTGTAPETECFPPALRFHLTDTGELSALRSEPIAADAREGQDGKAHAKLKLVAGLLGVNFDDLRQRENERRVRRLRRLVAGVAAVLTVFVGLSVYAWWQATLAREQRARADEKLAYAYSLRARQAADQGDDESAAVFYAEAYVAQHASWSAAGAQAAAREIVRLQARLPLNAPNGPAAIASNDTRLVVSTHEGPVLAWDLANGGRAGTVPFDSHNWVSVLALSPDGVLFATGSVDGTVQIRRLDTLASVGRAIQPGAQLSGLTFSQDGRALITWAHVPGGSPSGKSPGISIEQRWSVTSGDPLGRARALNLSVDAVSISPDRSRALLDGGKQSQLWDLIGDTAIDAARPLDAYTTVWSADGTTMALSQLSPSLRDSDVSLWDPATGRKRVTLANAGDAATFSPDGALIATLREDEAGRWLNPTHGAELRLWNARTGIAVGPAMPHPVDVTAARFSPDGQFLATVARDNVVRIWSVRDGRLARVLRHDQQIDSLIWTTNALLVSIGQNDVRLWDMTALFAAPIVIVDQAINNFVSFSPDGSRFATDGLLWNAVTGAQIGPDIRRDLSQVFQRFSPDSRRVVSIGLNADRGATLTGHDMFFARLWDARTGAAVGAPMPLAEIWDMPYLLAFSADGTRFATYMGRKTQVWDAASGTAIGKPVTAVKMLNIALTRDGKQILAVTEESVARQWDVTTAEPTDVGWSTAFNTGRIAPDANRVITESPVRLWDLATRKQIGPDLRSDGAVSIMLFSPDQRRIATVDTGGARVWSAATAAPIGLTLPSRTSISAVTFSADGQWLAIATRDNIVRLWNADTGQLVGWPLVHGGTVDEMTFDPNGRRLLTGSQDRQIHLFDVSFLVDQIDPDRLLLQVEAATGLRLNLHGDIEGIPAGEWEALRALVSR